MASQYQLIVLKITARVSAITSNSAASVNTFGTNLFNDLNTAGLVFKPTHTAAYVQGECHRYTDYATCSVDVGKLAFVLDQSQQGNRVVCDQQGGG